MSYTETITLPIELTNGNMGRGSKWFSSAKIRKEYEAGLRLQGFSRSPFQFPVRVTVTRVLGKGQRLWDYSSGLRGNYKEIEDSLVAVGWFTDDSPKYITSTDFRQDECRKSSGPFIELLIEQDGDGFGLSDRTGRLL